MLLKNKINIYLIFVLSLFVSFFFQENSSGGAEMDYRFLYYYIESFSIDFKNGFNDFLNNQGSLIHSPIHYILSGFLLKISESILFVKIIYLLISSLLPFIFYLILKKKFSSNSDYLFYLSLIIFFSPYYRSSAVWLLGDNLSLIFFSLSIYFYTCSIDNNASRNFYLCIIFLALCCYIRYYYVLFLIFYLSKFYYRIPIQFFLKLLVLCAIISLPAIYYFIYIFLNFDFFNLLKNKTSLNLIQNSLIILSIIFFYIFPFIIQKFKSEFKSITLLFITILIINFFISYFFFSSSSNEIWNSIGGGIFVKIFLLINTDINFFLLLISIFCIYVLNNLFKGNLFNNYFLILILILSLPFSIIYQKYLDPLFLILFFGLIESKELNNLINKKKINLTFVYLYFIGFLTFSNFYYYLN